MQCTKIDFVLEGGSIYSSDFRGEVGVYITPDCWMMVKAGFVTDALGVHNKHPDNFYIRVNGHRELVRTVIHLGTENL